MSRNAALRWACCWLMVLGGLAASAAAAKSDKSGASAQLAFGVDMAKRGLWNEALFRFEQARQLAPADARVWNDLAVAYEAVGRFDDAHAAYEEAVKLAPGNKSLRRNVSRFLEFYQGFKPGVVKPAEAPAKPAGEKR